MQVIPRGEGRGWGLGEGGGQSGGKMGRGGGLSRLQRMIRGSVGGKCNP